MKREAGYQRVGDVIISGDPHGMITSDVTSFISTYKKLQIHFYYHIGNEKYHPRHKEVC